jgi:site-specific DNA-methyltransferase (adenine-specific)
MVLQVKSGNVQRGDIAKLNSDMQREGAVMATLITLKEPTAPMIEEAKTKGTYTNKLTGATYDTIQIVTIQDIIENGKRMTLPTALDVVKKAQSRAKLEVNVNDLGLDDE